jgi:hypothetical protein
VDVEVDDEHAAQPAVPAQRARRDDDVVEDAEAPAGAGKGVVGTAAEVRGRTVCKRGVGGLERRADRTASALEERRRPRQAQLAQLLAGELAPFGAPDPVGRVREQQLLARRRASAVDTEGRIRIGLRSQQRVLAEREAVPVRKRIGEPVVREAAQAASLAAVGGELLQSTVICGSDVECGCTVLLCQGVHCRRIDVAESPPVAARRRRASARTADSGRASEHQSPPAHRPGILTEWGRKCSTCAAPRPIDRS